MIIYMTQTFNYMSVNLTADIINERLKGAEMKGIEGTQITYLKITNNEN